MYKYPVFRVLIARPWLAVAAEGADERERGLFVKDSCINFLKPLTQTDNPLALINKPTKKRQLKNS